MLTIDATLRAQLEKIVEDMAFVGEPQIAVDVLLEKLYCNQLLLLEICICAAIRLPDGKLFRGNRHFHCIKDAVEWYEYTHGVGTWDSSLCDDQGFITSRGRYVDREEGYKLQIAAGIASVAEGGYRGEVLYSEDLYL